jgi:hypothetical protein
MALLTPPWFKPYSVVRKPPLTAVQHFPTPLTQNPLSPSDILTPLAKINPSSPTAQSSPPTQSSPSPPEKPPYATLPKATAVDSALGQSYHSRDKGKSKWHDEDDFIPLAQLKRSRFEDTPSVDSLSSLEIAAYSLTQLQHAKLIFGSVQAFMASPLQVSRGFSDVMPKPLVFAPDYSDVQVQAAPYPVTTAIATISKAASMAVPTAASVAAPTTAYVAASTTDSVAVQPPTYVAVPRRFARSSRGRRRAPPKKAVSLMAQIPSTLSQVISEIQEEDLLRPPPKA